MLKLFLVIDGFVALSQISFRHGLAFFKLLTHLLNLTTSLLIKLCIIPLKSVHFSLQPSLFFSLNHASLFIFDLSTAH